MDYELRRRWAANIRHLRKQKGLSQEKLGELCGLAEGGRQSTVSRWERGEVIPDDDHKVLIARAFEVEDPRAIFPLAEPPNKADK